MSTSHYDVAIVGAGITGLMVAYELSKKGLKIAVFDKEEFAGRGVTSRQSEVIHVVQLPFSSLKSRLAREGNRMYDDICRNLSVDMRRVKAILVVRSIFRIPLLYFGYIYLKRKLGKEFRVELKGKKLLKESEPFLSDSVKAGIVVDGYGIVNTSQLIDNLFTYLRNKGVEFHFNCYVNKGRLESDNINQWILVETVCGNYRAKAAVIAAGLYSDEVAKKFGVDVEPIIPGKGVIAEFSGVSFRNIVAPFSLIQKGRTKGGAIIPTTRGSITIGPTLKIARSKEDFDVDEEDVNQLLKKFGWLMQEKGKMIKAFAGVRPLSPTGDFNILFPEEFDDRLAILHGIESPGLTASPAIAEMVAGKLNL